MRVTMAGWLALVSMLSAVSLPAQTNNELVGTSIRVTLTPADQSGVSRVVVGKLVAVGDSVLSVRAVGTAEAESIPASRVQRFEVGAGRDRVAGARLGAIVGLGFGLILGLASGEDCTGHEFICFDRKDTAAMGAVLGTGLGVSIGFAVGRGNRWREAPLPHRVSLVPSGDGAVRLAVSLQF